MKYSIGQVGTRFGLSRSALLYYDAIGLLKPSGRSPAGYRQYSEADMARMERIAAYREAGLALDAIRGLLDGAKNTPSEILESRLEQINDEIQGLRAQQQVLLQLLKNRRALRKSRIMTKERWVRILESAGMDQAGMRRWHVEFESNAPEAHQDFLEALGISREEVAAIRKWSKEEGGQASSGA